MDLKKRNDRESGNLDQTRFTEATVGAHSPSGCLQATGRATNKLAMWCVVSCLAAVGCQHTIEEPAFNWQDQFGRTYYIDGAGDWGFGVEEVPRGLCRAGYQGRIVRFRWSPFRNPALDQTIGRLAARAKGRALAEQVRNYLEEFPGNEVNIIALSAGTGVAAWACENLSPPAKINNLVFLGSSLSADYDMRPALQNIDGRVWVYHSNRDWVLQGPVRVVGTIDGQLGVDSAGLVGLRPLPGISTRIRNVAWSVKYERLGWTGAHTGAVTEEFAYHVLATHIVSEPDSNYAGIPELVDSAIATSDQQAPVISDAGSI